MESPRQPRRSDGRKAMLVYLDPALIRDLKQRALAEDTHAYVLVEQALREKLVKDRKESS